MTNQEKCALIAEEFEGYKWVQFRRPGNARYTYRQLLDVDDPEMFVAADMSALIDTMNAGPDYYRDLNACARAERVIAERGLGDAYVNCLEAVLHGKFGLDLSEFQYITASAQDRVDAMVMLISDITAKRNAQTVGAHDHA